MKPLLKPANSPRPTALLRQLGMGASTFRWRDRTEAEGYERRIVQALQQMVGLDKLTLHTEQEGHLDSFRRVYELEDPCHPGVCHGSASFAYMAIQDQKGCFDACLFWNAIPEDVEDVVRRIDAIWCAGSFDALYAYDEDDLSLQNVTGPIHMQDYGLDETQVEFVKKGPVTEIDTRENPGYFENRNGLHVSVQWLNYWSAEAQRMMFGGSLPQLPSGVEVADLGAGAVRVRLAKRPGRFDDVAFHKLQLECRRCLGLTP
jgi:hypothetical protein